MYKRQPETEDVVYEEDLSDIAKILGSRAWGLSLAPVGTASIFWGLFARMDDFGPLSERWETFLQLLSIDRVGSSFLVDLAIFGVFQGWLIGDDLKRRGASEDYSNLAKAGASIPFFGLAAYLVLRPSFPSKETP